MASVGELTLAFASRLIRLINTINGNGTSSKGLKFQFPSHLSFAPYNKEILNKQRDSKFNITMFHLWHMCQFTFT